MLRHFLRFEILGDQSLTPPLRFEELGDQSLGALVRTMLRTFESPLGDNMVDTLKRLVDHRCQSTAPLQRVHWLISNQLLARLEWNLAVQRLVELQFRDVFALTEFAPVSIKQPYVLQLGAFLEQFDKPLCCSSVVANDTSWNYIFNVLSTISLQRSSFRNEPDVLVVVIVDYNRVAPVVLRIASAAEWSTVVLESARLGSIVE